MTKISDLESVAWGSEQPSLTVADAMATLTLATGSGKSVDRSQQFTH